jgi:hypothetical protein
MHYRYSWLLIAAMVFFSCKKDKDPFGAGGPATPPVVTPPPASPAILLKEITVPGVAAPYFFEYDSLKRIKSVIVASGIHLYAVTYNNQRIAGIRNNTMVNKDSLQYVYDNAGRVATVIYINEAGSIFRRAFFTYNGQQLLKIEWEVNDGSSAIIARVMEMIYHPDGNLLEIRDNKGPQWSIVPGDYLTRFEKYDNKVNVDGFALIHDDIDHLLLLPGVRWQKNNPARVTRRGAGLNTIADYNYTYNNVNAPLSRSGTVTITSGPNAGQSFPTNTSYSYY